MARAAAEELMQHPERITLEGANGLERLGIRFQVETWIQAARARFTTRSEDSAALSQTEATAFWERYREIDLNPLWMNRLEQDGWTDGDFAELDLTPQEAMENLQERVQVPEANQLLHQWGRTHAWFGHVYIDGAQTAVSFDGFQMRRATHEEEPAGAGSGWIVTDLLLVERDFTLRRAGEHASLRYTEPGATQFLPDQLAASGHSHSHDE